MKLATLKYDSIDLSPTLDHFKIIGRMVTSSSEEVG